MWLSIFSLRLAAASLRCRQPPGCQPPGQRLTLHYFHLRATAARRRRAAASPSASDEFLISLNDDAADEVAEKILP